MQQQGSTITEQERLHLERFSKAEDDEIQQSESVQPYSISLMGLATTISSLDESKAQMKELMSELKSSKTPKDRELLIRCAKEIRETMKVKLEVGKFAHAVGGDNRKTSKETA